MESIHEKIKEGIRDHRNEIELTQIGITSAIASLVYSEYIRNFKQVTNPTRKIFVSEINNVIELLSPESEFTMMLSDTMIDSMAKTKLIQEYINVPELVMFKEENIDILKSIFELYIMPNVGRSIPNAIVRKFGLSDESNQLFYQTGDIDLFNRVPPGKDYIQFIVEQAVLQILLLAPEVKKKVDNVESNNNIKFPLSEHAIISIGSDRAISVIHVNETILGNAPIMDLLEFVTSTKFTPISPADTEGEKMAYLGVDYYKIVTSPYNQAILTFLNPAHNPQTSMF